MQLSFRDPAGFVFTSEERVFRLVHPHAAHDVRSFLASTTALASMRDRKLIPTTVLTDSSGLDPPFQDQVAGGAMVLEHARVMFPSYPYEWAPEMLHAAARLTLALGRESLSEGFALKDATPYNVMFEAARPTFIDVLSFDRRDLREPTWRAYAQFVQTFLYPLLANRFFGLRLDEVLLTHREGLEPERMVRLCPVWRLLVPPFPGAVTIPALMSRSNGGAPRRFAPRRARDDGEAAFLLEKAFSRAERQLERAAVRAGGGAAVQYMERGHTYGAAEMAAKERFVAAVIDRFHPAAVLDIGANTGHFSLIAARRGARVVAIDRSPEAIGMLWRAAEAAGADVLPLVVDIARPPGACGWANRECPSFLERARERFDCVLMLALVHHLIVNERIPLASIFDLASSLTSRLLIIEYVDPADSQFRRIARGRDVLHRDLSRSGFEAAAGARFDIAEAMELTPTRRVYRLEKKRA